MVNQFKIYLCLIVNWNDYKTSPEGEFKTIEVPKSLRRQAIDEAIIAKEGKQYSWYAATEAATTPTRAILEARFAGLQYQEPDKMSSLVSNITHSTKGRGRG